MADTYETAKARVEAGDLSFEAIGALTIAHGEKLVRESDAADSTVIRTAEFTNGSARRSPLLTLYVIRGGRRSVVMTQQVAGKREARAVAQEHGYTPWNF